MESPARHKALLTPRNTVEMAEFAATQIREAIVDGRYAPGDRLVESDLAEQLQVSRHPVREALRHLDREGFVTIRANRGAVVADIDAESILEVYEIRAALGMLALRHLLLGPRGMPRDCISKLEALAEKARTHAVNGNQRELIKADLMFQLTIVEASGLGHVTTYFAQLNAEVQRFNNSLKMVYSDNLSTVELHLVPLLEALRAGDLEEAERIWQAKFVRAATHFMEHIPEADKYRSGNPVWLIFATDRPAKANTAIAEQNTSATASKRGKTKAKVPAAAEGRKRPSRS